MAARAHGVVYSFRLGMARALRALAERIAPHRDPVMDLIDNAPWDDEPLTDDEARAIEEGHRDYLEGKTISIEELKRKLG